MIGMVLAIYCSLQSHRHFSCSEVYNKYIITQIREQYGEVLHSCVVFSLIFCSGKYLHTHAILCHTALSCG